MMTFEQKERFAELSLIFALPKLIRDSEKLKGKRLGTIFDRLQKHARKEISKLPKASTLETAYCLDRILEFGEKSGWLRDTDTISGVSFTLGLIEQSIYPYPQTIIDALNDAFERLTYSETEDSQQYINEAERALEKWRERQDD
jgi:hypothetical protein